MSQVYVFHAYGGPEHQELTERPTPHPGPGHLAVRVHAAGVNPFDWKLRAGLMGRFRDLPAPMGEEVAGTVTAVGEGVEGFAPGDAVLGTVVGGLGGFAEHTLLPAAKAVHKPAGLSFTDAAAIPIAGATAYAGVHQLAPGPGQVLLINGAGGGVGLMAAQIARAHGLRVIGTGSESKRQAIEATGADFVAKGAGVVERVRGLVPGGVDIVLDLVGGQALRTVASLAVDPARVISPADADTAEALGGSALRRGPGQVERVTALIAEGLVDPNVTATYPLERAGEALARVEGGHSRGKVVLAVLGG